MAKNPDKYRILVVDDEPDIHALTRLSLKRIKFQGKRVELAFASTGAEAVQFMEKHPDTAVILMDVVMENDAAGLEACQQIRYQLGNEFVRILLRTGQPGAAPEKTVIDEYDIDGYLAKQEMTTNRLYTAVRTAIKSYDELMELQRHRTLLTFLHENMSALHSLGNVDDCLQRILETAAVVAPSRLAVLNLEWFSEPDNPQRFVLYTGSESSESALEAEATALVGQIGEQVEHLDIQRFEEGYLLPFVIHRNLGYGWLYLELDEDELLEQLLPILLSHASNALYSNLIEVVLKQKEEYFLSGVE